MGIQAVDTLLATPAEDLSPASRESLKKVMEVLPALEREELRASGERALAIVEASEELGISDRLAAHLLESPDLSATQVDVKESLQRKIGDIPSSRNFARIIGDTLQEALTFGSAETQTFNWESLNRKYDAAREEMGSAFEQATAEAESLGKRVAETKTEYLDRVLPSRGEFVQTILDAQPALAEMAKEVGLASIPIYGTIRTWEDSPNWARALGVASDLVFLVPIVGQGAAASRAGLGFGRTTGQVAIAELMSPITTLRHPIRTLKTALEPLETIFSPRKIPIEALEVRTHTIRIPVVEGGPQTPHTIRVPIGVVSPEEAMLLREKVTLASIRGERAVAPLGRVGEIEVLAPALQRVTTPAAVTNSPDIRNFFTGLTVGDQGGSSLYLAPGRMSRFVRATAGGLTEIPLSEKAEAARRLGLIPDTPVSGSVIIRDPALLTELQDSGKLYRKGVEIETTLPVGTHIPPPSQVLYTRSVETGERSAVLIIGKPFTPVEIARLKLVGPIEAIRSIFSPGPGRFTPYTDDLTRSSQAARQATALYDGAQEARTAGNVSEALRLERSADEVFVQADTLFARANLRAGVADLGVLPIAAYTGDQDIVEALRSIGTEVPAEVDVPRAVLGGERVPPERALVTEAGELAGRVPPPEAGELRVGDELAPRTEVLPPERVEVLPPERVEVLPADRVEVLPPDRVDEGPPPRRGEVPPDPRRYVPPPGIGERVPPPPRQAVIPTVPTRVPTGDPRRGRGMLPRGGGDRRPEAQELRERAPGVTWQQGRVWIALYPPYTEDDILISPYRQPINTEKVNGPKKAWDTIKGQGYEIDYETYDEWAAWFAPKGVEISARLSPSVSISPSLSVSYPADAGGMPLATRRAFWWHVD
ncbi:hypothetical protein LCGC14_0799050 [marine sediment metagenome]|uniref:Uncharacterized protein n=1 Tax=marine sediment metagenome TaxID=412755 RepID=A0A0F9QA32_9ZZZZ